MSEDVIAEARRLLDAYERDVRAELPEEWHDRIEEIVEEQRRAEGYVPAQARFIAASPRLVRELLAQVIPARWTPTQANINALPDPVRAYIHDLETRCDPAGDVRALAIAGETLAALSRELEAAEAACATLRQQKDRLARALHAEADRHRAKNHKGASSYVCPQCDKWAALLTEDATPKEV